MTCSLEAVSNSITHGMQSLFTVLLIAIISSIRIDLCLAIGLQAAAPAGHAIRQLRKAVYLKLLAAHVSVD